VGSEDSPTDSSPGTCSALFLIHRHVVVSRPLSTVALRRPFVEDFDFVFWLVFASSPGEPRRRAKSRLGNVSVASFHFDGP
jgi:hypothetical protein